jgi:tetratricopeptide (TPR) repeat protein
LRAETSVSSSLAAVAIAAHEVGHALQFARGRWAHRLKPLLGWGGMVPAAVVFGLGLVLLPTVPLATLLLLVCTAIVAIRLPLVLALEVDATRQARQLASDAALVADDQWQGFEGVLRAGFLTHLALAAQQAIMVVAAAGMIWTVDDVLVPTEVPPSLLNLDPEQLPTNPLYTLLEFDLVWPLALAGLLVWFTWLGKQQKCPTTSPAVERNNAAMALYQRGQFEQALAMFDKALACEPKTAAAHYNRAMTLATLGRTDEALYALAVFFTLPASAIEGTLSQPDIWHLRGTLRLAKEDHQGAIDDLSQAIERLPTLGAAWRDRGLARLQAGEYEAALEDTHEAVRLDPNDAIALNNRGVARSKLGDWAGAADDLREAIRLAPEFPNPHRHFAWLKATCPDDALRDGSAAVEHATRALELTEWKRSEWLEVLAAAQAEAGNAAAAVDWQEKYLCTLPGGDARAAEAAARLELYRDGRPLREQPVLATA